MKVQERCVIVDGHSLMYRAFHALPLMDADGVYTNAVHGFLSMLLRVFREQRPQYCAVAFDDHTPTFRHEGYEAYKAGRSPMPEELRPQFPLIQELLSAMGIGVVILPRWEADDVLGTISRQANERGIEALLLTGDRDALQLVGDDTKMLFTRKGISETILFDPKGVKEYFGVSPEQVPDWKGLMGDSSDNIPGIPGVGEKTAVKLLDSYGTLEGVLEHADEIKGKLGEKVRDNKELARMSKRLATIDRDAPLNAAFGEWTITKLQGALPLLKKYQLNVIAAEVMKMSAAADVSSSPKDDASLPPVKEARHIDELLAFAKYLGRGSLILCLNEEGLSFSKPDGQALRLKFQEAQQDLFNTSSAPTMEEALKAITPLLQKTGLITHDAKRFLHRLPALNLPIPEVIHDTMVLCYLRNPQERGYELSAFAAQDAQGIALLLKDRLEGVRREGMEALYRDIELPLVRVLFDMEAEGFQVDKDPLIDMGQRFSEQTKQLQEEIYALTGVKGFNINSPQQLGRVLFEDLKLPSGRKTRTGYSTDADTLEGLKALHPAIDKILEYRQIVKLNGTYIEGLLRKVDATGRIHTTFDQVGTA
ncbi:MAG: DNA polymerase I, partial [Clostridia bacterium]|nr:DNA polymerase I [Clostridia bacterium]